MTRQGDRHMMFRYMIFTIVVYLVAGLLNIGFPYTHRETLQAVWLLSLTIPFHPKGRMLICRAFRS